MTDSVGNTNVPIGTKRAQEPSQTGRDTKMGPNSKQALATDMKHTTNKTKGIKGGNNLSKEPNDNSKKRNKSPSVPNPNIPKVIDITNNARNSFFSSQIEAVMFAFGESRYVTGDILELMEETVRQFILFVIRRSFKRKSIEESRKENQLTLSDIIGLIQKDRRLTRRTCAFVKSVGVSVDDKYSWKDYTCDNYSVIRNLVVPFPEKMMQSMEKNSPNGASFHVSCNDSDSVNENTSHHYKLENNRSVISETIRKSGDSMEQQPTLNNIDIMTILVSKAAASLSQIFPQAMYHEYSYCRKVSLTASPSQQRNSFVERTSYFLQWLRTTQNEIHLDNAAIHALGYLSWEAIGLITQTSLVLRYMSQNVFSPKWNSLQNKHIGSVDPRRLYCCTAQQFILALRHGLGTWVVLPLNDEELGSIAKELERKSILGDRSTLDASSWQLRTVSQLQVFHILDALRFLRDIRRCGTCTNVLVNLFGDSLLGR